jgi:hypothetical protein
MGERENGDYGTVQVVYVGKIGKFLFDRPEISIDNVRICFQFINFFFLVNQLFDQVFIILDDV